MAVVNQLRYLPLPQTGGLLGDYLIDNASL
jgi:hypothetical protein